MGVNFGTGRIAIYADGEKLVDTTGLTFDGSAVSGIRLGSNGTTTFPSASDFWRYDNIKMATDSISLFGTSGTPDTTYYDSPLVAGTSYTYRVRAYTDLGNLPYSDTLQITTQALVIQPITLLDTTVIHVNATSFEFVESVTAGVDSTLFEYGIVGGLTTTTKWIDAGQDTFTIGGLTGGTNYSIRGRAYDFATNTYSVYSSTKVWTTDTTYSGPPAVITPTSFISTGKDTMRIHYSFFSDYDSIWCFWKKAIDTNFDSLLVSSPFTLAGLTPSTQYLAYLEAERFGVRSLPTSTLPITTNDPWSPPSSVEYTKYVTVTGAGDPLFPNGSLENPMTLNEARVNVVPGDYVFVAKGFYDITGGSSWSRDGTAEDPIIIEGEMTDWAYDYRARYVNRDSSTVFYGASTSSSARFTVSADYVIVRKIVFELATAKYMISVSGQHVTLDSIAGKYPSDEGPVNSHFSQIVGNADYFTVMNSTFNRAPRTALWVNGGVDEAPDYATIKNNIFHKMKNHNAFQLMPYTDASYMIDPVNIIGTRIEGNWFIDNPYSGGSGEFYARHNQNITVINNIFINSGRPVFPIHPIEPTDTMSTALVAYNLIYTDAGGTSQLIYNEGQSGLTMRNNILISVSGISSNFVQRHLWWSGDAGGYPLMQRLDSDYNLYYSYTDPSFTAARFVFPNANGTTTSRSLTQWRAVGPGRDQNSIIGLPTFVNAAIYNFRHASINSIGANDGTPVPGVTVDILGNPRHPTSPSMGPFEFAH